MKKSTSLSITVTFIALLLAGCSMPQSVGCLPPPVASVPASLGQHRQVSGVGIISRGGMPSWWNIQPNWLTPFVINYPNKNIRGVNDIALQDDTVWVSLSRNILHYSPATGASHSYEIKDKSNNIAGIRDILVTKDGAVWALAVFIDKEFTALTHYNPQTDNFEFVSFVTANKELTQEKGNRDFVFFVDNGVLVEDSDGNVLMPFGKNIVSYNPHTNLTKLLLPTSFPFYINALVVHDNKAWFTVSQLHSPIDSLDMDLRSVDLQTGKLTNYGHAPNIINQSDSRYYLGNSYSAIGVDKRGRIWVGYFARLQLDQNGQYNWEQVTYPPEFVLADDPDFQYLWASVNSIYPSFDGNLWFHTEAGLVKYDVDQDKWCLSTPIANSFAITDDGKGNLWMVTGSDDVGHFYKYNLNP